VNLDLLCNAIIDEILDVSEIKVDRFTPLLEEDSFDSFAMLAVIGLLEELLSIEIDPDSLTSKQFSSVENLATWALALSKNRHSG
jgi:acyl carrier protein